MEPEAKYTLVGAVVIVLVLIAGFSLRWLNSGHDDEAASYIIYFKQQSLGGLQINSFVTMRGIRVGSVRSLSITPHDIEAVRVEIAVRDNTPIKADTEAVIQRNLLTGFSLIDLIKTTQASPKIKKSPGEVYPIIPEGREGLSVIQDTLPEVLQQAGEFIQNGNKLLSAENRESLGQTLRNFEKVSGILAGKTKELEKTLDAMNQTSNSLKDLATNMNQVVSGLVKNIESTSGTMTLEIGSIARSINAVSQSVSRTFERYEDPRAIISGPGPSNLGPGEQK